MKQTVINLLMLESSLVKLAEKEFPISTSLKINQVLDQLSFSLHSVKETAQPILKKEKSVQEKELNELYNQEIDVDLLMIDLDALGDIRISPNVLKQLEPILKTEKESEKKDED